MRWWSVRAWSAAPARWRWRAKACRWRWWKGVRRRRGLRSGRTCACSPSPTTMRHCWNRSGYGRRWRRRGRIPTCACGCGTRPVAVNWPSMPTPWAAASWAGSSRTGCWWTGCGRHCPAPACSCIARRGSRRWNRTNVACACAWTTAAGSMRRWPSPPMAANPPCARWPGWRYRATTTASAAWSATWKARAATKPPPGSASSIPARWRCCRWTRTAVPSSGPCPTPRPSGCWRWTTTPSAAN